MTGAFAPNRHSREGGNAVRQSALAEQEKCKLEAFRSGTIYRNLQAQKSEWFFVD